MSTNEDHTEIRDLLPLWVAGRLDGDEAVRVEAAVAADPDLAHETELLELLAEGTPDPPADLAGRIVRAVREDRAADPAPVASRPGSRRMPRWGLAVAAAAVVALGGLELMERGIEPVAAPPAPLDRIALAEAPSPWVTEDAPLADVPELDDLSDEALSSLLEELEG